jgi:tricorn protease
MRGATTVSDARNEPYVRFPSIRGGWIVFSGEDDLWRVPADGGPAWRLTAGVAEAAHPHLSPDGSLIAFVGQDEGPEEVHVMPADGGDARRLTYDGANCTVVGWDGDAIVYASNARLPFVRDFRLHRVDPVSGLSEELPFGNARSITRGPDGGVVIGRNVGGNIVRGRHNAEPATWKRYRGGTAGTLWIDPEGSGEFKRLLGDLEGNLAHPCGVSDRIYLISDHEGVGNVYSCRPDGADLHRHSGHEHHYARGLTTDGARLVYHCGGEIHLLDPADGAPKPVAVELPSSRPGRGRRFVDPAAHLQHATLGPDGTDLALTIRGKAFTAAHWEGPVRQHGEPDGVRYRLLTWLADHDRLVAAAGDEAPEEHLVVLRADGTERPQRLDHLDVGRPTEIAAHPHDATIAVVNHRNEVLLVDLDAEPAAVRELDRSTRMPPGDLAWSPDGRWLAYTLPRDDDTSLIKLADATDGSTHRATRPVLRDCRPSWDPEGRYLYFLGQRAFDPVPDEMQFGLGFPLGWRPMLVTLRADVTSPFVPEPRPVRDGDDGSTPEGPGSDAGDDAPLAIDLEGIDERVLSFPVPLGRYERIAGTSDKVLFTKLPVEGVLDSSPFDTAPPAKATLEAYDLDRRETETLLEGITDFSLDRAARTMLVRAGDRLRVLPAGEKPSTDDGAGDDPGRTSGWLDLGRVKVSVRPHAEWRQMFRDAWRLQRAHYWDEGLAGLDWDAIYERYLPLVDRVATRSELSDLIWELQAELGTSHAYEIGGDHGDPPNYRQGHLGVDWELDPTDGTYRVAAVVAGDVWDEATTSALNRPGVDVRPGDRVVAIDGRPVGRRDGRVTTPGEALVNRAETEVEITVVRGDGEPRTVTVKALADERGARYRDWVEANRAHVHDRSDGRVGYVHIPDMGPRGFGEFHRGFLVESERDALIVDVRFNGGGNVSPLLLEKLVRRRYATFETRHFGALPWPPHARRGPVVAITNERAGSDGDIFSHAFKRLELGPLIGTRTWGGVVGVWPRQRLADGTITTQPEFHMTFDDVGRGLENRGAEPDIVVEITPQDHVRGDDPQLERAIEEALRLAGGG